MQTIQLQKFKTIFSVFYTNQEYGKEHNYAALSTV